ncbi:hypothetical protein E5K35_000861 [Enterococcus faecalis]|nr:hypothetical protein [Enterococcus faecalis]EGO8185883.1 hypothetical protein [Enterococcus faecalis]EHD7926709.1 hypothetical protein [Enterococcus faecalis]EKR9291429.1 hypothetical protein [Enterococcus faecalis]EKZ0208365.1 hypothetical protein [Enterococcus faecalis]
MDMTDKVFTLEVKDEYSESKTNIDETFNDDVNFVVLPNGTMIVKNPKVTRYIEKLIENATKGTRILAGLYTTYRKEPWNKDIDCLKYDAEIQKKMKEHAQKESSDVPLPKETTADLLEIKLKDTDSIPEVYYKGQRLDKYPRGLIDVSYNWHTEDNEEHENGLHDISIEYYNALPKYPEHLDRLTIKHHRDA